MTVCVCLSPSLTPVARPAGPLVSSRFFVKCSVRPLTLQRPSLASPWAVQPPPSSQPRHAQHPTPTPDPPASSPSAAQASSRPQKVCGDFIILIFLTVHSAEALDQWFENLQNYEATLVRLSQFSLSAAHTPPQEEMAAASLDVDFKEELGAIEQCTSSSPHPFCPNIPHRV